MGRAAASEKKVDKINTKAWDIRLSEAEEARQLARKALAQAQSINYQKGITESQRTLSMVAFRANQYAEAYEFALLSAKGFKELDDKENEAIVLNILGGIYNYLGDHENRLEANLRSLQLRKEVGNRMDILTSMNNTGDTYIKLGDYKKALELFDDCLEIVGDERDRIRAIVLCNMGEIYMLQKKYKKATEILEESLDISREVDYTQIVIVDLIMLGNMCIINGEQEKGIALLKESLDVSSPIDSYRDMSEAHELLSQAYDILGDPDAALEHFKNFFKYKNLVINETKLTELKNIQFRNELSVYQSANARLESEVEERTHQLKEAYKEQKLALEIEQAVNYFSQSLLDKNTVEEVVWGLVKNTIAQLNFVDCVVYLLDEDGKNLIQKAAYGGKNPEGYEIHNPIIIPVGQGIVGTVAASGKAEVIDNTSKDPRYIVDDEVRLSEIAVPIKSGTKTIGVIDSEHPKKKFFTEKHLRILTTISAMCANKIQHLQAEENKEKLQRQLIKQLRENEQLQTKVNRELEEKVKERTLELEQQKQEITDSISYARTIQESLLPNNAILKSYFPDLFIYYQPKDIVSGDFYWTGSKGADNILAIADCTGHGVPGALMSVLGVSKLELALERTSKPGEMLSIINREVRRALSQTMPDSVSRDGMDVGLIKHDTKKNILHYAGANRPIWLIRDGELSEIKGTRSAIGGISPDEQQFETHTIQLQKNDTVYLFTDGYADQFGGKEGRKMMVRRFRELLLDIAKFPLKIQQKELHDYFEEWKGTKDQVDDLLVAGIKF